MLGIYYKDGVYVVIDNDQHEYNDQHYCCCVYHYKDRVLLYGGRVRVKYLSSDLKETAYLLIDGLK